ncbi:hypothetical protein C8A03DRAFT_18020 [Achaetomium macrosporum]|uniref:Uncharacterized protein n=1 Tax=Achaetomium macrosporum TaxID=79813 RepID=A0AAN7C4H5_9PEZI|nr:hypothetical protein C8A03DRAFT_18020 [Achaetomium macrosporum]
MCILRIPRHPWCYCPDPSAVDSDGNLTCPHHIWLRPDTTPSTLPSALQTYLHSSLASIPRPAPEWEHCTTYRAAHKPGYLLDTGYELSCPETVAAASSSGRGYKSFYTSDNMLCADCSLPRSSDTNNTRTSSKKKMIPLRLVPLRERFEIDSALDGRRVHYTWYHDGEQQGRRRRFFGGFGFDGAAARDEPWEELVPCGLELLNDGQEGQLDEAVEKRILTRPGAADDWGVYVDVVEGVDRQSGSWGLDADASAVYLLPGMGYDAGVAGQLEMVAKEEEAEKKRAEGWLSVGGVMKAMGKFL